jgi:hypothetical protein
MPRIEPTTSSAVSGPQRRAPSSTPATLTLQEGREFLGLMTRGLSMAVAAAQETPAQRGFIQDISRRGAELAATVLAHHGYDASAAPLVGRQVQALQLADTYLYPQMELLERPELARPADVRELMMRHVAQVGAATAPSADGRTHREAAALAVVAALGIILEANPSGFQLDADALGEVRAMTDGFDALYPNGLS